MILVKGNNVFIPRGDTGALRVNYTPNEEAHLLENGDKVFLTVRERADSRRILLQKEVTDFVDGVAFITFRPEDTNALKFGVYVYDIEVNLTDGTVDTLFTAKFEVGEEVTYGERG